VGWTDEGETCVSSVGKKEKKRAGQNGLHGTMKTAARERSLQLRGVTSLKEEGKRDKRNPRSETGGLRRGSPKKKGARHGGAIAAGNFLRRQTEKE